MNVTVARHDPYAALRIPNFRWFIVSLLTMNVATQLQAVVVAWQIYALTHDPLSLGLIGLAGAIPFIGFASRIRSLTWARRASVCFARRRQRERWSCRSYWPTGRRSGGRGARCS
jgi:hypothetical protein